MLGAATGARRARRALEHAFLSPGFRLFGPRFARDYLRFAIRAGRSWGSQAPGTMRLLGWEIGYFNQSHALFLLHEIFADATYAFRHADPRPRIIDCGANIGFSCLFFKALYPASRITAVEPDPISMARLQENLRRNRQDDVELRQAAIAASAGPVTLFSGEGDPGSLVSSLHGQWSGAATRTTVPALRLPHLVDGAVDFLKVDIEGAEYDAVRDLIDAGAAGRVREMAIEHHPLDDRPEEPDRMIAALAKDGFLVERVSYDPASGIGVVRARRSTK